MKTFKIAMENAGFDEVRVTVQSDEPVEFQGAESVITANSAIYKNNAEVHFRLKGTEPTEWFSTLAMRKGFNTAARFSFEKGA